MGTFNFLEIHHQKLIANSGVYSKQNEKKNADAAHPLRISNFFVHTMILLMDQLEMSNDCFDNIISKGSTVHEAAHPPSR